MKTLSSVDEETAFNLQRCSVITSLQGFRALCSIPSTFKVDSRNYGRMEFLPKHNSNTIKAYVLEHAGMCEDVKPAQNVDTEQASGAQRGAEAAPVQRWYSNQKWVAATKLVTHTTICQTDQVMCGPIWEKHPSATRLKNVNARFDNWGCRVTLLNSSLCTKKLSSFLFAGQLVARSGGPSGLGRCKY